MILDPSFEGGVQFEGRIDPGIENHALVWGYPVHGFVILDLSIEGGVQFEGSIDPGIENHALQ